MNEIKNMNLQDRIIHCLKREGIEYAEQVKKLSLDEAMKVRNLHVRDIKELESVLNFQFSK